MKSKLALLASVLGLLAAAPGWAGTITFNFSDCSSIVSPHSGCPGDIGNDEAEFTDTTKTYAVFATSAFLSNSGPDLFVKDDGGSENGLGLAGTYNNEINYSPDFSQYVVLYMGDLAQAGIDSGMVTLGSLQSGESGLVCNIESISTCQSVTEWNGTGYGSTMVTWSDADPFLIFGELSSGHGNFLISSLTANVPEPGSLALLGVGLAGLGFAVVRRKRARAIK